MKEGRNSEKMSIFLFYILVVKMKIEELEGEVLKQQDTVKDKSSGLNGTFRQF